MAKIVHTILFGEDINCSRQVYIDNCVCQLFLIRHDDSATVTQIAEDIDKPAVYILLNRETKKAYIGQTDSFKKRLQQHWNKSFWTEAMCFQANDNSLHLTSIHYLEAIAYDLAKKVDNYDLSENTQVPKKPATTPQHRIPAEQFFEYVQFLTKFVGCDIFTEKKEKKVEEHVFFCKQGGCDAKGILVDDGFIAYAGSALRVGTRPSAKAPYCESRKKFIAEKCNIIKGTPVLKEDYKFTSPSIAAAMFIGGSANGWTQWVDAEGRTLDEVYRGISGHKPTQKQKPKDNHLDVLKGKNVRFSLNGKGSYRKFEFAYRVIEEYLVEHPKTTFNELQQQFPRDLVGSWSSWPLLQPDLDSAQRTKAEGRMRYYEGTGGCVLTTSDGIRFMVSSQWDWKNLKSLLDRIEELGMSYKILM